MSWVTPLRPNDLFLIGPRPTSRNHVGHLIVSRSVVTFVDVSRGDREAYHAAHVTPVLEANGLSQWSVITIDAHFNPAQYKAKGRDERAKRADLAAFYVRHADQVLQKIRDRLEMGRCYVYAKDGDCEEVFVAFALWRLAYPEQAQAAVKKNDPVAWIVDNQHERLLQEDNDLKLLLGAVWDEAGRVAQAKRFFGTKRAKIE